jgi:hypothetical protein
LDLEGLGDEHEEIFEGFGLEDLWLVALKNAQSHS